MYTHTYTFINMYFDIYFFLCLSIRSVLIFGFSKSCCSPAEVDVRTLSGGIFWSIHDKSIHRTLLRLTQIPWQWDKVPSGKRLSPGAFRQIWSPTVREKGKEWFRIPVLHSYEAKTWSGNEREKPGLHPDLPHCRPHKQKLCWNI